MHDSGNSDATVVDPSPENLAEELRKFGAVGILSIIVILIGNALTTPFQAIGLYLPGSAILVLVWARLSRTPLRDLGLVRPDSWTRTIAIGALLGVTLKLVTKSLILPLLGADPVNHSFHYLAGNRAAIPVAVISFVVGAGFGEELLFRGYMFERLGKLFGSGNAAKFAIVIITSSLFALGHYSLQGIAGVTQAAVTGLVFGGIYARTGRLIPLMVAHAAYDLAALALIYWNLETPVAHLVFT